MVTRKKSTVVETGNAKGIPMVCKILPPLPSRKRTASEASVQIIHHQAQGDDDPNFRCHENFNFQNLKGQ
jgi:hypothetical protein